MTDRRGSADGRRDTPRWVSPATILLGCLAVALAAWQIAVALGPPGGSPPPPEARTGEPGTAADGAPPRRDPESSPPPASLLDDIPDRGLALGITEPNPALIWSPAARPSVPAPFERWRRALGATRPAVYRLMVSWRQLQPEAGAPVDLDAPQSGCLRDRAPCAPWAGVREQLAALASRQREGGWEGLVVLYDTPDWAAQPASDCDPPETEPRARAPRPEALVDYRALIGALREAAAQQGASLRYWSAWNEPNHPYFLARQRGGCDMPRSGPPASVDDYVALVRALDVALRAVPDSRRVLGELAAIRRPGRGTSVSTFIGALPRDVVCGSAVFSQHAYAGGWDPVDAVSRALSAHRCAAGHRVWITETGAGLPGAALSAGATPASRPRACRRLHERLTRWWEDPRVDVALQYTWREDDLFRVGLVATDLAQAWPTLAAWRAWTRRPEASSPPPTAPCPVS